ncbi:hypothetical protein EZV62_003522 [Acer yangbiense]|uniref:RRM domain-containing protein n=1 Tax=Acer yangbiense TaxID=1000413 RepID=A0A5C7IGZ3_9ROSI|nr:hypothetical protein EZV62_003522 [Acer yangbiense]
MDDLGHYSQFKQSIDNNNMIDNNRYEKNDSAGKLFVGGVSWETTEDAFADYFSQYGEIVDSILMMDRYTGRPRGFGFVTFADPAIADQILEKNHVIDGRAVEVKKTVPREEMVKEVLETKKIFVGGMPPSLTEDDLEEYFSSYGNIVENQIMLDHITGRSRGFGFVTFETADAVEKVLSWGKIHELGGKQVEIKKAEPRRHGGDHSAGSGRGRYTSRVQYDENMDQGYNGYAGYDYYGGYGGSNGGNPAGFYCGYGGYGYGFGFVNPMYGAGYGVGGYGIAGSHGDPIAVYGGTSGFETGTGGSENRGNGSGGSSEIGRFHPYKKY